MVIPTLVGFWSACLAEPNGRADDPGVAPNAEPVVNDLAESSGYDDRWFGSWKRGRATVVVDFDQDGRLDVFSGNPGDASFLLRNVSTEAAMAFEPAQRFSVDELLFTGAAGDFDNDGDPDLYLGVGGNEGRGFDRLLRNDLGEAGISPMSPFTEVSGTAELVPRTLAGDPIPTATAGAVWFDVDNDGWLDMFVSNHLHEHLLGSVTPEEGFGLNQLWHNNRDGTFQDVAWNAGLRDQYSTRNSAVLDFDRDGDVDLFENNFNGPNTLWRNEWQQTGEIRFTNVTAELSLGGSDLSYPRERGSMCAVATDLDNDGWEDLVIFRNGRGTDADEPEAHDTGHLLWMNVDGRGFVEVARHSNLNDDFHGGNPDHRGVMGCQVGDVDADGFPDLFMGNGAPDAGGVNRLFVASHRVERSIDGVGTVRVPWFRDWSHLIDLPPGDAAGYPYRTHGTAFADFDGDGLMELAVHNGGPSLRGTDADMQEPNRLFDFVFPDARHWLRVRLLGDGMRVNCDGVGAEVRVTAQTDRGPLELFQVRHNGAGFAAQNDPNLLFGLGTGATDVALRVTWPDGHVQHVSVAVLDQVVEVRR